VGSISSLLNHSGRKEGIAQSTCQCRKSESVDNGVFSILYMRKIENKINQLLWNRNVP
jgi:hypothetical protein